MSEDSGQKIWPILDLVVFSLGTIAFLGVATTSYSLQSPAANLLLAFWPFLLLAYLLIRTHAFAKHDEDVEEASEGYIVPSLLFYVIALSGPMLLALYQCAQLIPELYNAARIASVSVYAALIVSLLLGIDYVSNSRDTDSEPWTSFLFIPISLVSGILWLGSDGYLDYSTWLFPTALISWNEYIRLIVGLAWIGLIIALILLDTFRKIKVEGIGFGERWKGLRASTQAQPRSRNVIKSFIRALRKFGKFLANVIVIILFTIKQTYIKLAESLLAIKKYLNFGRLKLLGNLILVTVLGLIIVNYAPTAGVAAYRSVSTAAYDSGLLIFGLFVIVWSGSIAVLHSHVRLHRHFETAESFASVVLFSALGIWVASALFHALAALNVRDLPGFGWSNGPFFVVFGIVWLTIFLWEVRWAWFRVLLIAASTSALALWFWQSWPSLQAVSLPEQPTAAIPTDDLTAVARNGSASPSNVTVIVEEPPHGWIYGRWGLYGTCRNPILISGAANELTIERDSQVERVPIQLAAAGEVVARPYRFNRSQNTVTVAYQGEDLGQIIRCAR